MARIAATLVLCAATLPAPCFGEDRSRAAPTAETPLSVGDLAPPLVIERWIRGGPIERLHPGTVYVLDFAAPWCAPCMALLPHMSAVQDRFAAHGVRVVAVFGPDTAGTTTSQVEAIVAAAGDQVRIEVAYDARDSRTEPALDAFHGQTTRAYLERAELEGIPATFVVDGAGRVAWIGLPSQVAGVVEQVVAGAWDMKRAGERYRAGRAAESRLLQFKADLAAGRIAVAMAEARRLVDGPYADDSGALRVIAASITGSAQRGAEGVDLDLALTAILRAEELSQGVDTAVLTTRARLHFLRGEAGKAVEAQRRAVGLAQEPQRSILQKTLDEYARARPR
jgi:thiol-disulfide isomerase/thioredoxin